MRGLNLSMALMLALAPLSGCTAITHFGDYEAGDDTGPRMDGGQDAFALPDGGVDAPGEDAPGEDAAMSDDAHVLDAPAVDAPVADAPVADAPVADAPVADAPVDAPIGDDANADAS